MNPLPSQPQSLADAAMPREERDEMIFRPDEPLALACGEALPQLEIAYQTYGALNAEKSNAVLICHGITGDQHAAGRHPITEKPGWWDRVVGEGKVLDPSRYFVICANVLGGCMGSTGPGSLKPGGDKPYGLSFPAITIGDMVEAQRRLIDHLGIERLLCVIGGSMGGMQALRWAARYSDRLSGVVPIATAARHSAQNIAFHEVGRQAIMADPRWLGGDYAERGETPQKGLAVARMAAHITYLSEPALHRKFGRNLQDRERVSYGFEADFQIESYLRHQGFTFVDRFDANSYLYLTRAMDYFDLAADYGGNLAKAFAASASRFCLISFTSDWLFPTADSRQILRALNGSAADASFVEIESDKGHDAFLLDEPEMFGVLDGFLKSLSGRSDSRRRGERGGGEGGGSSSFRENRVDLDVIAGMIAPEARVLDIGCGDGELLSRLIASGRRGVGIELSQDGVNRCVARGLSVVQGDADTDLADYPDGAFDDVVLSQTLQAVGRPRAVLEQMLRIGSRAIVSFPNFGHWRCRLYLAFWGRMPMTLLLPHFWFETPNAHLCTVMDFERLCWEMGLRMERFVGLDGGGKPRRFLGRFRFLANLFSEQAVFLLTRSS